MKDSPIFICVISILFPFILLFGFYVIINGHNSPGGGFQGGAILATAALIIYFVHPERITNLNLLIKIEKLSFMGLLIVVSLSYLTRGTFFTNFIPLGSSVDMKKIFLIVLNFIIAIKVALGFITIFSTFIKEGER
ncbi:MnhB domain-containing protein [Wukongibacter sp. M2B1]|uniref:MnhB domain-containing protein n=1 Tax=Wukongibacter sp. M2B1 TaxID=3088895 RepID=UPI003D7A2026